MTSALSRQRSEPTELQDYFRANGGTRTPDVCMALYKSAGVATDPHWLFELYSGIEPNLFLITSEMHHQFMRIELI